MTRAQRAEARAMFDAAFAEHRSAVARACAALDEAHAAASQRVARRAPSFLAVPRPRTVLVVDDNPDDAELLRRDLSRLDRVRITVAHSADEAERLIANSAPGVALVDADLGIGGFGPDLARKIPRVVHVILVSGVTDEDLLRRLADAARADAVLSKVDRPAIVSAVRAILDGP